MNKLASRPGAVLAFPEDWWVIPLAEEPERLKSIKALVEKQLGKADVDAQLRAGIRNELEDVAEVAASQGGVLYGISLTQVENLPLSASAIIYREAVDIDTIRVRLLMSGADCVVAMSEYGNIYRSITTETGPAEIAAQNLEQLVASYWLNPQDGHGVLHAVFTTPHLELQEPMLAMFDAVISTITVPDVPSPHQQG